MTKQQQHASPEPFSQILNYAINLNFRTLLYNKTKRYEKLPQNLPDGIVYFMFL